MTLAVAVLVSVLVPPANTALAATGTVTNGSPYTPAHDATQDDESSGDSAENHDEGDEPGHVHHEDDGEGDESGGHGPCAVVAGPVSVCLDELKN